MTEDRRPAFDLLREWIANDHPVYWVSEEIVRLNREYSLNYGNGLRDLILDIRGSRAVYRELYRKMSKLPEYRKNGHPVNSDATNWTMGNISDKEFGEVDWTRLADDLFGELHAEKNDEK